MNAPVRHFARCFVCRFLGLPLVFMVFAITFLKEKLAWNYLVAFVFLGVAAFFAFAFKALGPAV